MNYVFHINYLYTITMQDSMRFENNNNKSPTFPDLSTADTTKTLLEDPDDGACLLRPSGMGIKLSSKPSKRWGLDRARESFGGSLYLLRSVPEREDADIAQLEPHEQQLDELFPEWPVLEQRSLWLPEL